MKIAIIISDPNSGNLFYPVSTASALKSQGHEVTAFTWTTTKSQMPDLVKKLDTVGVCVEILPALSFSSSLSSILKTAGHAVSFKSKKTFDTLICFGPYSALQFRLNFKVRRVVTLVEAMGHDGNSLLKPWIGALMLNLFSDKVVALCGSELERLIRYRVRKNKLSIVFNPVDVDGIRRLAGEALLKGREGFLKELKLNDKRKYIAHLASFQPRKRHDIVINAFAQVASEYIDYDLVLAGNGEELDTCKRLVAKLGIKKRVRFLGRVENNKALGLIVYADCVVHASNAETFGYSMIEPLLLGKPAVFSRTAIGFEVEKSDLAEIVSPDDVGAFSQGLRRVLNGGAAIESRMSRGPAFVENHFRVEHIASQLVELAG